MITLRRSRLAFFNTLLDTGTIWKDVKEKAFNPVVNTVINIASAVTMIIFPPTAAILLPLTIAYNETQNVDQFVDEWTSGTLTAKKGSLHILQFGLDILPLAGRAPTFRLAGRSFALFELANHGAQALLMTAQVSDAIRDLRDTQVKEMAEIYAQYVALETTTQASDPRLVALRADLDARAEAIRNASVDTWTKAVAQYAIVSLPTHLTQAITGRITATKLGDLVDTHQFVPAEGVAPHYDAERGQIVGDTTKTDGDGLKTLVDARDAHFRALRDRAAKLFGVAPESLEVLPSNEAEPPNWSQDGRTTRLFYKLGSTPEEAFKLWAEAGRHLLITSRVAEKPAGARIGDTVDLPFQTEQQEDIARWQTHGLEDTAHETGGTAKAQQRATTVRAWLADPDFRHWYDVWMSMPDRIVVDASGKAVVKVPRGVPPEIGDKLGQIGAQGNVGLMTRALDVAQRVHKAFPNLDTNPESDSWKQARPKLVEMLGEEQVAKYETEHGRGESADVRTKTEDRLKSLFVEADLKRVKALLPGLELYVTGSTAQASKNSAVVSDLDLVVVTPAGTPMKVRVELENRLRSMTIESKDRRQLPIDAKVMTPDEFMGYSMNSTEPGRAPLTNVRIDAPTDTAAPGTGVSGRDLHNHIMGVPSTQYFIDKIGHGDAALTLETLMKDLADPALWADPKKAPVTTAVMAQLDAGYADVQRAKQLGMDPSATAARARRTLDDVLSATETTPFDATYDVRDILVQKHIDPNGTFENFGADVLGILHDQGITASEQSVSASKLAKRFTPEGMASAHRQAQANSKDSELDFLVMEPTSQTLSSSSLADLSPADASLLEQTLMRKDVAGEDVAGPEDQRFTKAGMSWLKKRYAFLSAVARKKQSKLVLRPHVGEGYDPGRTGAHVDVAKDNLRMLTDALAELGYDGRGDVIVRLGHATHTDPETMTRLAAMGIYVEANVGSNLATGSILNAADHPLLENMYFGVKTVLSTDGQGVMSTTLHAEYLRAASLIDSFVHGAPLQIGDRKISYAALPADIKQRFSVQWLMQQASDYGKLAHPSLYTGAAR